MFQRYASLPNYNEQRKLDEQVQERVHSTTVKFIGAQHPCCFAWAHGPHEVGCKGMKKTYHAPFEPHQDRDFMVGWSALRK